MTIIDFILIAVILAGIVIGARRGLIHQIASIIGLIVAIVLTRIYGDDATRVLLQLIPSLSESGHTISSVVGHVCLFVLVYFAIQLFGSMFRSLFHSLKLGAVDRLLGAVFCVIKYCLVLSVVLNIWLFISPTSTIAFESKLVGGKVCRAVVDFAPWLLTGDVISRSIDVVKGDA